MMWSIFAIAILMAICITLAEWIWDLRRELEETTKRLESVAAKPQDDRPKKPAQHAWTVWEEVDRREQTVRCDCGWRREVSLIEIVEENRGLHRKLLQEHEAYCERRGHANFRS